MLRRIVPVAVFCLAVGSTLTAEPPTLVIDQIALADSDPPFTYAVGGASGQVLAQTVTAGVTGRLMTVQMPLGCAGGRVVLEIRDVDSTGQPGSTVYHRRQYPGSRFSGALTAEYRDLDVGGLVSFAAGETFAIVLSNIGGSCGVLPGPTGDTYLDGAAWSAADAGPFFALVLDDGRDDLPFRTIMRVP